MHERIFEQLHIPEQLVRMIQIDCTKRHFYVKISDDTFITDVLQKTKGRLEYKNTTG